MIDKKGKDNVIYLYSFSLFQLFLSSFGSMVWQPCPKTCSMQVLPACFVETGVLRDKSICITRFHVLNVLNPETHLPLSYST